MKRLFDLLFSFVGLLIFSPIILIMALVAALDTGSSGFFLQDRVGQHGKLFRIIKLRTISAKTSAISKYGKFLRRSKIDELPQLYNVLIGEMSFVGPRPDVPGYADVLKGKDRAFLKLQPGLTGLASLKYRNEEALLALERNPLQYNDTVIWPDKIRLNNWYEEHRSFGMDFLILCYTFLPFLHFNAEDFMEERGISEGKVF
ncbi:sugar transferase [Kaistella carnis]|uniref:sugar transferase n=1 Tax=Kaistella carnis TaxID=1241979 RepID=UPI0028A71F17|nr:sugar transferase [Kaistella carnis]